MKRLLLLILLLVNSCILIANPNHAESVHITTERISGNDRYDTSIVISQREYEQAENIILINGTKYADAHSVPLLSQYLEGPVLLTRADRISPELLKEIKRLKAKNIYLIGGESCISEKTEEELARDYTVTRLSGKNRYETALEIANKVLSFRKVNEVVLSNGSNLGEGAVAGQYSFGSKIPTLLLKKDEIPKEVLQWIKDKGIEKAHIIGNENSVVKNIEENFKEVERLAGNDIYELSAAYARKVDPLSSTYLLVSGENIVDHIPAMGLRGKLYHPILFVKKDQFPNPIENLLKDHKVENLYLIGGENALAFKDIKLETDYTTLKNEIADYKIKKDVDFIKAEKDHPAKTYIRGKENIEKALDIPDAQIIETSRGKTEEGKVGGMRLTWDISLSFERENGKYVHLGIDFKEKTLQIQEDTTYIEYTVPAATWPEVEQYGRELIPVIVE